MKSGEYSVTLSQNAFGYTVLLFYKGILIGAKGNAFKKKEALKLAQEVLKEAVKIEDDHNEA
jgi:hypothetical protein